MKGGLAFGPWGKKKKPVPTGGEGKTVNILDNLVTQARKQQGVKPHSFGPFLEGG